MKRSFLFSFSLLYIFIGTSFTLQAQDKPLSEQMAATVMDIWADSLQMEPGRPVKWSYDQGVILEGIDAIWKRTGNGKYFDYMKKSMDLFVTDQGEVQRYKQKEYNIDHIKNARTILTLYKVTGQQKYFKAATLFWEQLQTHPRTKEGGFWHKKIYPNQMWLDGLYMGQPFYAEYAALTKNDAAFDDIANQFIYMENHARDAKTGLLYHGWDESKVQKWANPKTGTSPNFWGRAMGWYGMGLVDVLDNFPEDHPKRKDLLAILKRFTAAVGKYQDAKSGLWYDVMDLPKGRGNYFESSAANMFVYAIAKGVRKGYLPASDLKIAQKGYAGIKKEFIEKGAKPGQVNLKGTVTVSGLGGNPYRDGSYEYYISEKVITNDPKGVGAFLLAASEMELAALPKPAIGKTVLLDSYFNNEMMKNQSGHQVSWHYKWPDLDNNGISKWGGLLESKGFKLATTYAAPSVNELNGAAVYIIVDPDTEKETPNPNFIKAEHIKTITNWVKAGGVLVLMGNDLGNAELDHFNELTKKFGITFNKDTKGRVTGNQFEMGAVAVPAGNSIFKKSKKLYIKEYSSLTVSAPAASILKDKDGSVVMAVAPYMKGKVFVIGDPWLYNEYIDGRKLPVSFDNFQAAEELSEWLAKQVQ
jgi:unsaturated rhamnogalacturonyl hydrolase